MTINELDNILTEVNYYENFKENFLNKSFNEIDYGKRLGAMKFNSFFDANNKYSYSNQLGENIFTDWNLTLNNQDASEEEIFVTCLEIFEWGNVLNGNVKTALDLYKNKKLKSYINWIKPLLNSNETIQNDISASHEIIWSSGWTKVYSFMNNDILIYDSRVSAFLNYSLTYKRDFNSNQIDHLSQLANNLYNFNGAIGRVRQVDKSLGFKNQHPKGLNGLNANLISSWMVQLLNKKLGLNQTVRSFERAFFMLGFDLKQIY